MIMCCRILHLHVESKELWGRESVDGQLAVGGKQSDGEQRMEMDE